MIDSIEALSDCIQRFEGWFPPSKQWPEGSNSWRNRNPGNLRPYLPTQQKDIRGYRVFNRVSDGQIALFDDLSKKINGITEHRLTPKSTLHDLFSIYAPPLDNNNPTQYSAQIANWLTDIYKVNVFPATTLADILKLGAQNK